MAITEVFATLDPFTAERMWGHDVAPQQTAGRWDWLVELVDQLPADQREVIEALYWEQLGQRTIADRVGLRRAEVRTLQRQAFVSLRESFAGLEATFEWMAAQ